MRQVMTVLVRGARGLSVGLVAKDSRWGKDETLTCWHSGLVGIILTRSLCWPPVGTGNWVLVVRWRATSEPRRLVHRWASGT